MHHQPAYKKYESGSCTLATHAVRYLWPGRLTMPSCATRSGGPQIAVFQRLSLPVGASVCRIDSRSRCPSRRACPTDKPPSCRTLSTTNHATAAMCLYARGTAAPRPSSLATRTRTRPSRDEGCSSATDTGPAGPGSRSVRYCVASQPPAPFQDDHRRCQGGGDGAVRGAARPTVPTHTHTV